mgnify:CR=1 FL=1
MDSSERGDFIFRRGCTLVVDANTRIVRHIIKTKSRIDEDVELDRLRDYLTGADTTGEDAFRVERKVEDPNEEDFSIIHRKN